MIEVKNVYKGYRKEPVLKDVSLTVVQGEIHGLIGENSAGKTTLIKILAGLLTTDDGVVKIDTTTIVGYGGANKNPIIPDDVVTIKEYAFSNNQLTSITIGSGIKYIECGVFYKDEISNPNLSKITINKSCFNIKEIKRASTDSGEYYPWLSGSSPYTASGVTIYGSNNEVCDTY